MKKHRFLDICQENGALKVCFITLFLIFFAERWSVMHIHPTRCM